MVEDEKELAKILGDYLKLEGFDVIIAKDGEEGLALFRQQKPELLLLDIMLPKLNGIEICKEARKTSDIPIIMLSAKDGEMDKVISLGAGADDYVTKPFSPLELVARVKAQMRRYGSFGNEKERDAKENLKVGSICFHVMAYEAYVGECLLQLTTKEFEVLLFFAEHQNQVFSREQIYAKVWGSSEYGDISSVAVYIRRLRNKLEEYGIDYIKTIWGAGYKMTVD